jgi:hypothetical protein
VAVAVVGGALLLAVGLAAWHRPTAIVRTASAPQLAPPSPSSSPAPGVTAERGLAEESRTLAATAREAVTKAEAERLAPKTWTIAATTEREADTAFDQQELRRAQGGYQQARRLYEQALVEAQAATVVATKQAEVGRAQEAALQARQVAERAEAAQRAPVLWARAVDGQRSAEDALKRQDVDKASRLWRQAEQGYRDAERAAREAAAATLAAEQERLAALTRGFQDAEQAGAAAMSARRDAEQAGAPRYAAPRLAAAAVKEREAQAAPAHREYSAAKQRFQEAQQEYQLASQEAQQAADADRARTAALQQAEEAQRLATQKQNMDRARTELAASRQAALDSEAERLARFVFNAARVRETEADRLGDQQHFMAATATYRDAASRYNEARRLAQIRRNARSEADQARAAMLTVKQRARQDARDFGAAVLEEQQATSLYDARDFAEATRHFQAAGALFAKTTASPSGLLGDRGGSADKGGADKGGGDKGGGHK